LFRPLVGGQTFASILKPYMDTIGENFISAGLDVTAVGFVEPSMAAVSFLVRLIQGFIP
jgi:hypothetical protein